MPGKKSFISRITGGRLGFGDKKVRQSPNRWVTNKPNKHRSFFGSETDRLLQGWDTTSRSIDHYLRTDLRRLVARARSLVRMGPAGKQVVRVLKSNVIGPKGFTLQVQTKKDQKGKQVLDKLANNAIEKAFKRWGKKHSDYAGKLKFKDHCNLALACAITDGEFVFRKHYGNDAGPFGFQLEPIDPELIATDKNHKTRTGEIRLGVEYNKRGRVLRYWFREKDTDGGYFTGRTYSIAASHIIHGFIPEWVDQSRGVPWLHAGLETTKHLEKYYEAAIVASRSKASTMGIMKSTAGSEYEGEDDNDDEESGEEHLENDTSEEIVAGIIKDIGNREYEVHDPKYPHEMYDPFMKDTMRRISAAFGVSYHSLSNDLTDVNYSSIRAGVLEDREIYKALQDWFAETLLDHVYEEWVVMAYARGELKIGRTPLSRPVDVYMEAAFQGRRWAWVDPQKDGQGNNLAVGLKVKSRSQIIREQGDDPETVFAEIAQENERFAELKIDTSIPEQSGNGQGTTAETE